MGITYHFATEWFNISMQAVNLTCLKTHAPATRNLLHHLPRSQNVAGLQSNKTNRKQKPMQTIQTNAATSFWPLTICDHLLFGNPDYLQNYSYIPQTSKVSRHSHLNSPRTGDSGNEPMPTHVLSLSQGAPARGYQPTASGHSSPMHSQAVWVWRQLSLLSWLDPLNPSWSKTCKPVMKM